VNTNQYKPEKLKDVMDKEKLNWRSYADDGKIVKDWNLRGTPTLFLIDHKGIIRYRWLGSPGDKAIDTAIHKLVKEASEGQ
jgi:peroxiredoxin